MEAVSLRKSFRSGGAELVIFSDLSVQIRRGERLAIIGESGAGKSTLLHLLGGLDRASEGSIYFEGRSLSLLSERKLADFRNRQIGFVWQNPSLLPEFTALENVMMPSLIRGASVREAVPRAKKLLTEAGLEARLDHRAGELSGGEQQRVALARALISHPRLLLADEPTGSLDYRTGEAIIELLFKVHETHGLTSVFVTHNLSLADRCDRVLELKKGSLHVPLHMAMPAAGVNQDATRLGGGTYV